MHTRRLSTRAALAALLAASAAAQIPAGGVEQEVKLDATTPGLAGLLAAGDRFGRAVSSVRDVDLDGNGDIIVGAPWDDDGGPERGAAYILLLEADGSIKETRKISSTAGGFTGTLADGAKFGNALAYLGDFNEDGNGDVVIASLGDDDGGTDTGAIWILFLNADGTMQDKQKISPIEGELHFDIGPGDRFGRSVAALPDMNGDGTHDIAVGATGDDDAGFDTGCVYILFLGPHGKIKGGTKITTGDGGFTGALANEDRFGQSVCSFGDQNGDGFNDIVVGAWNDDTGGNAQGALWVLFLDAASKVKGHVKLAEGLGGFDGDLSTGDKFGGSVTAIGDLDGDEVTDLAVGSYFDDDGGVNQGAVWILFMNPDGTAKGSQKISELAGAFEGQLDPADRFAAVSTIDDMNGDGTDELGVGAMGDSALGPYTGACWLLYMHASEWHDLGLALPGKLGASQLSGIGSLEPATEVLLTLGQATPVAPVSLVIGLSTLDIPFAGGVLVPTPDVVWLAGQTNGLGFLIISGRWPPDVPPATSVYFQAWMPDKTAPEGLAASNGLEAVAP